MGKFSKLKEDENTFGGAATLYTASWRPGTEPQDEDSWGERYEPGHSVGFEPNLYCCKDIKCSHGPDHGPSRKHGGSGTTPIHQCHLNRAIRKLCKERQLTKANSYKRKRRNSRPIITVQIDRSTCLSYNGDTNEFGYDGIPNGACNKVAEKIQKDLNVIIDVDIQPTHTFDLNSQDAMYHALFKYDLEDEADEGALSKEGGVGEL